jgi:hypothetical protein
MQITQNYSSTSINLLNKQCLSFKGNQYTGYCLEEARKLIDRNKELEMMRPQFTIKSLKALLQSFNPYNWYKIYNIKTEIMQNKIEASELITSGRKIARIDNAYKKTNHKNMIKPYTLPNRKIKTVGITA